MSHGHVRNDVAEWVDTDETKTLRTGREVVVREKRIEEKELKCPLSCGGTMRYKALDEAT